MLLEKKFWRRQIHEIETNSAAFMPRIVFQGLKLHWPDLVLTLFFFLVLWLQHTYNKSCKRYVISFMTFPGQIGTQRSLSKKHMKIHWHIWIFSVKSNLSMETRFRCHLSRLKSNMCRRSGYTSTKNLKTLIWINFLFLYTLNYNLVWIFKKKTRGG